MFSTRVHSASIQIEVLSRLVVFYWSFIATINFSCDMVRIEVFMFQPRAWSW